MGKRKHKLVFNNTQTNSEIKKYSSRIDSMSKEKSTQSIDRHAQKSLASIIEIMDNSAKRPSSYHSYQIHNRPTFLSKPQNFYGCQYSRRKSLNNDGASSSSHVRSGEKVWLRKASTQSDMYSSHHKENKKKAFWRHERNRTSSFVVDSTSTEEVKLVCGLCKRSLKGKPFVYENTISLGDLSVVAILVCGHVYHADCLEQNTRHEDIRDPLCPSCANWSACTN